MCKKKGEEGISFNEKLLQNKGITLIALVITIIVLLILAGVTIAMLTGENGILNKSKESQVKTNLENAKEQVKLEVAGAFDKNGYNFKDAKINLETNLGAIVKKSTGNSLKVEYSGYNFDISSNGLVDLSINKPVITSNMKPIKYVGTNEIETITDDPEWYNYIDNNWANAKTTDGSYFVWIPRYEYKITNGITDINKAGTIDVNFVSIGQTSSNGGYTLHPAFTTDIQNGGWDKELSGIWVAKYEMSMETNGVHTETIDETVGNVVTNENIKVASKPGVTSWRWISIGNCYLNSFNYDREKESHLIKNSEWGAVAYLTHSKYGTNGKAVETNGDVDILNTGGGEGDSYKNNTNQSSTKNVTGIYDLSGICWEYTASWDTLASEEAINPGSTFATKGGTSTKYAIAYTNGTEVYEGEEIEKISKNGDAMKEVYVSEKYRWFRNFAQNIGKEAPFYLRGGNLEINSYSDATAGIFASGGSKGLTQKRYSFRTVLVCE